MAEWSGIGPAEFIGLENFRRLLFEDRSFWQALWHNWAVAQVTTPTRS